MNKTSDKVQKEMTGYGKTRNTETQTCNNNNSNKKKGR